MIIVKSCRKPPALRIAIATILLAGLAAGIAPPAEAIPHATTAPARSGHAAVPASGPALLTADEALAQAESTNAPVVAGALNTDTSTTTANPDGSFTTTVSAEPTQAFVNGAWTPLDPTLQANSDGTFSPAVSAEPLNLSGGGTSTLATMSADGRTMSMIWPGTLPTPTVSGDTATYADVFSGVDLQVTADDQGGLDDVLIVHSAAAAANPALASLSLTLTTTGGLVLSTDATGDVIAAAGSAASDEPLLSLDAPEIWDSTLPPSTMATVTNQDGVTVEAASGDPVASTADQPGAAANIAAVPVTLSGNTLTLTPPASILTGANTTYPVFIDPRAHNYAHSNETRWAQVFSGFPTDTAYYNRHEDLRVGVCPADLDPRCYFNGVAMGVARSFVQMPIPSRVLRPDTDVISADLYMTEDWSASCTPEEVRLYPVTGTISRATDWTNAPAMPDTGASYSAQAIAFGHPGGTGCTPYSESDVTWNVQSTVASDAHAGTTHQIWGLRATDESTSNLSVSELSWKNFQTFYKGKENITLVVGYNYPPDKPDHLYTDPGGGCHTSKNNSKNNPVVIGNDDVRFYSLAQDEDGDQHLTSTFTLYRPDGTVAYSSAQQHPNTNFIGGDDQFAQWDFTTTGMQNFGGTAGKSTAFLYYYQTQTSDDYNLNSLPSDKCWILYNPKGPSKPTVTYTPGTVPLGGLVTASFSSPGCSATSNPCPTQYVYQEGADAPVTVSANATTHTWSGSIRIIHVGPVEMEVYSVDSAGNVSEPDTQPIIGTVPATKYKDGYFSGGPDPDLLAVGTGSKPSLWLYPGYSFSGLDGFLGTPVDIGSLGDAIQPGTDGRGDWKGAMILHGDFTGHNVQDVMAWYPSTGSGVVIDGTGSAFMLDPWSGSNANVQSDFMTGPLGTPTQLTAAGNASGLSTGTDDLIGIATDGSSSELDLYTSSLYGGGGGTPSSYSYCQTITPLAPGGSTDNWDNYTLATAGNPSNTVLFALNSKTHALYESTGPFILTVPANSPANTTPDCTDQIKQPSWKTISVSWFITPTGLAQGDINAAGATELWVHDAGGDDSYTLSGTTLGLEEPNTLTVPNNDWALGDGNPNLGGASATTANDSITGSNANVTGNVSWSKDSYFVTDLSLDGSSGYVTPPSNAIPSGAYPDLTLWFKANGPGVIASVQGQPLSSGTTTTGGYDPVLYIGKNGLLYAEWWNGSIDPIASTYKVDNGIWHEVEIQSAPANEAFCDTGTNCVGAQWLYLDGQQQGSVSGNLTGNWSNLDFGAGYTGGGWPNYPASNPKNGNEGFLTFFNGEIAGITMTNNA